jgi:hypothetical protein
MLIPPSVLMIVWCVLTELSIGQLFLAGVIRLPAAAGMVADVVVAAGKPELVGETATSRLAARPLGADVAGARLSPPADNEESIRAMLASTLLVISYPGTLSDLARSVYRPRAQVSALLAPYPGGRQRIKMRSLAGCVDVGRTSGPAVKVLRAIVFAYCR